MCKYVNLITLKTLFSYIISNFNLIIKMYNITSNNNNNNNNQCYVTKVE